MPCGAFLCIGSNSNSNSDSERWLDIGSLVPNWQLRLSALDLLQTDGMCTGQRDILPESWILSLVDTLGFVKKADPNAAYAGA